MKKKEKRAGVLVIIIYMVWFCCTCMSVQAQAPVITSFSPVKGPVGTTVTISGNNFNALAANNMVYFGAVKATISAATTSLLTVTVPIGATHQPLIVTTANLTAFSTQTFTVTFPSNPAGINTNSFAPRVDFGAANDPASVVVADFDADGKSDMASANQNSNNVSVFKNTGTPGIVACAARVDYAAGAGPVNIAVGDIDGDGKPDMVVVNSSSNSISVFKNTSTSGSISFAAKIDYATGSNPYAVVIGDFDVDGQPDLVVTNRSFVTISVFKNQGIGGAISFAPKVDIYVSGTPSNIAMNDLDGDGKPDLAITYNATNLSILRNTSTAGTISFAAATDFTVNNNSTGIWLSDLDGDGKAEIAVCSGSSGASIFRNTCTPGTISFAARIDIITGNNAGSLAIADLDGDGRPDLALTNIIAASVSICRNTGSTGGISFAAKVDYATGSYPYSVAIGDLDGDGKPDLAIANHHYTSSSISVIRNQVDGPNISSFSPANGAVGSNIIITGTNFSGATSVTIGGAPVISFTLDSDSQITAVVPAIAGGSISVTSSRGSATLPGFYNGVSVNSIYPSTGAIGTPVTITGSNFSTVAGNNVVYTGAVKATVLSATANTLSVNVAAGTTYEPVTVTTANRTAYSGQAFGVTFPANATGITANSFAAKVDYGVSNGANPVAIGDIDGDGKADMVSSNYNYNSIFIFRNLGTAGSISFSSTYQITNGTSVTSLVLADMDGDGRLDIVVSNYIAGLVSVYRNTSSAGTLSFAAKTDLASVTSPASMSVGDLDADGRPDFAVVSSGSSIISLFRNTTAGTTFSFSPKTDIVVNSATKVTIGDLDADGRPELAVANYYAATVSVLKNTSLAGSISFAAPVDYAAGTNPASVSIADIDSDGKRELVVANSGAGSLSVLKNLSTAGTISFASKLDFTTGAGAAFVSVADINGDGKADLVATNTGVYSVSILQNNGSAGIISFLPKVDYITGGNISNVSIGDLDTDGKPDMAIINAEQATMSLLRNQTAGTDLFSYTPANAPVGSTILLKGINFTGTTAVTLAAVGVSAFSVVSDTLITAIVGGVGGGRVSVTSPGGTASLGGFYNGPVIQAFLPASGIIGSTVTITGSNFNAIVANNIVYFGPVKATVVAGSTTALSVIVPVGATYQAITVSTNNLTAYSAKKFTVTFPFNSAGFNANTFASKVDYPAGTNPAFIALADLDGDGKSDMISANYGTNTISIYKNGSLAGTISFATTVGLGSGYYPNSIATGDFNGDGKTDIAVVIYNSQSIAVFRNTSAAGVISFASELSVYAGAGSQPRSIAVGDIDGDGKPDIALANSNGPLAVFRNVGTPTTLSFAPKQEFTTNSGSPYSIAIGDFDEDGKPDLALTNYTFSPSFVVLLAIFKNFSQPGIITLGDKKDFVIGANPMSVAVGDLDGDGKLDIAVANTGSNTVSVLRNITVGGSISFAAKMDYITGSGPYSISLGDVDGDEKIDMVVANSGASSVSVFKNIGSAGNMAFNGKVDYATGNNPYGVALGDLDGDGMPDMAVANYGANTVSVLKNQVGAPNISAFTPGNANIGTIVTINGTGFTGTTSVSLGAIAVTGFTVISDTLLSAMVGGVGGGNVAVTTPKGTAFLSGFYNGPVITSFSPASGNVGAPVVISGFNFSAIPAENIVFFGAVKAVIATANSNALNVVVPAGTTYQPISVTSSNLTAYASRPFVPTFAATASGFTAASFAPKSDFATGVNPGSLGISDLDGDGKPDMAVSNGTGNSISIFRNLGPVGTVAFAAKLDYPASLMPGSLAIGDLEGDGKPDIVVLNYSSGTVSVFKNISTPGSILFSPKADFACGPNPATLKIADLNADGKPELIVVNSLNSGATLSVLKNISGAGTISFSGKIDFITERYPQSLAIADLDGDGKPDLAVSNSADRTLSLFRNTGSSGSISFAAKVDFATTANSYSLAIGDLDGDGKADIASCNYLSSLVSVFRNTSIAGTLSLAPTADFLTGSNTRSVSIGDLDGDGKPDLAVTGDASNLISVLKNTSSGALSFATTVTYTTGITPQAALIADVDGDEKADLAVVNYSSNTVSVFRNQLAGMELCAGGSISYRSSISGATYQWQVNTGSGFTNINDNSNYAGTGTSILQLNNIPSLWYGYQYKCVVDGDSGAVSTLSFSTTWTGAANSFWENAANWSCGSVPDAYTDVIIGAGTVNVHSNAVCRSLKLKPGVSLTVDNGFGIFVNK